MPVSFGALSVHDVFHLHRLIGYAAVMAAVRGLIFILGTRGVEVCSWPCRLRLHRWQNGIVVGFGGE